MKDLRILPKVRDSWSYLYVERARIDQEDKGICLHDERGRVHVPCASLSLLMLGPGTTVTHAAVMTMAEAIGRKHIDIVPTHVGVDRFFLWSSPNRNHRPHARGVDRTTRPSITC